MGITKDSICVMSCYQLSCKSKTAMGATQMTNEKTSIPTQAPPAKRRWSKPSLTIADVKEVTAGAGNTGSDGRGSSGS